MNLNSHPESSQCKLISSRECRMYAILIGVAAVALAIWGAASGSGAYPRWFLGLICGWILLWPMARFAGFLMNAKILTRLQEQEPMNRHPIEEYRKARFRRSYMNSQFIVRKDDLEEFLYHVPEEEKKIIFQERDMAQRVVSFWTYVYFLLLPVIIISCVFVFG